MQSHQSEIVPAPERRSKSPEPSTRFYALDESFSFEDPFLECLSVSPGAANDFLDLCVYLTDKFHDKKEAEKRARALASAVKVTAKDVLSFAKNYASKVEFSDARRWTAVRSEDAMQAFFDVTVFPALGGLSDDAKRALRIAPLAVKHYEKGPEGARALVECIEALRIAIQASGECEGFDIDQFLLGHFQLSTEQQERYNDLTLISIDQLENRTKILCDAVHSERECAALMQLRRIAGPDLDKGDRITDAAKSILRNLCDLYEA